MQTSFDEISDNFAFLSDWEDRYRYVIDLGKRLEPLPDTARVPANKVEGCASQVWVETTIGGEARDPILRFRGDSDSHIVKGLVAIILALYSGQSAARILELDAQGVFAGLGLAEHLTPQRSNGVRAMVDRVRRDARVALGAPAS